DVLLYFRSTNPEQSFRDEEFNLLRACDVHDVPAATNIATAEVLITALDRGELAANSDHYPFAVRGVPCIFLENQEGSAFPHYHTPADNIRTVRFDSYPGVFKLVTGVVGP
ncbi:MAG: M28 family peptidase, partial [Bacteroidales bacterium]|nr:M28 family peptidase [Bacteroidales bacterium]